MMDKAISMDACDIESQTSSMVDDVFFVLQKSLRRALLTGNINLMCAVLNNATSMLTSIYKNMLKEKLEGIFELTVPILGDFVRFCLIRKKCDDNSNNQYC